MKQRRGLRVRESALIICILFLPLLLVGHRVSPNGPTGWGWVACIVYGLVVVVLICMVEDALERRGRYVDSGASWEEIWSWLNYVALMVPCFIIILVGFAIWWLSDDVSDLGLLVVIQAALAALNIVFGRRCLRARAGRAVLEGTLSIVEEWDTPYEYQLDGEDLAELLIRDFGLGPDENAADFDRMRMLIEYGPFDFGRVRITIERLEGGEDESVCP